MSDRQNAARVVLITSECHFAWAVFDAALDVGVRFERVLLFARHGPDKSDSVRLLAAGGNESLAATATQRGIECEVVMARESRLVQLLSECDAQLLLSVCYPRLLSPAVYKTLPCAWNVHPSLLPQYRGPDPLFWQLRDGVSQTGVTVHELSERLDSGAVVAQSAMHLEEGMSLRIIERALAAIAAKMIRDALLGGMQIKPQNEVGASRQGWPEIHDFEVKSSWSTRRARNFVHALRDRHKVFVYRPRSEAIEFVDLQCVDAPGRVRLNFADGPLWATLKSDR